MGEDDARAKLLENGEWERFCTPIDRDANGRRVKGPDEAQKNHFPMDCNQVALLLRLRRGCWICSVLEPAQNRKVDTVWWDPWVQ
jgi:hypothetical protein